MIKVKVLKNENFKTKADLPKRGTPQASCYDVVATSDPEIIGDWDDVFNGYREIDYIQYETALFVQPVKWGLVAGVPYAFTDTVDNLAYPRSSIRKYNLALANSVGTIDQDFRNGILVCFKYVFQPKDLFVIGGKVLGKVNMDKIYKKGDKICQLRPSVVEDSIFELVDELSDTQRGLGGFGSTGK